MHVIAHRAFRFYSDHEALEVHPSLRIQEIPERFIADPMFEAAKREGLIVEFIPQVEELFEELEKPNEPPVSDQVDQMLDKVAMTEELEKTSEEPKQDRKRK